MEEAKELAGRPDVRLMSLMDHTPGQRQFRDEGKLRDYYRGKGAGKTDAELDELFEKRTAYQKTYAATNMREIVALAHRYGIPLASFTTIPPGKTSAMPSAIASRSRNFRPRWRRRAACIMPASAF